MAREGRMDLLIATGISVGILAGLWAYGSVSFQLITFAGFLSWASFYAAGGQLKGLRDSLITNFSGVLWGYLISQLANLLTPSLGQFALGLAVVAGAGGMVWQAKLPFLGFIPGAFIGCSTFFAANANFWGSEIGLILGAVLGYLSQQLGILMAAPRPAEAPAEAADVPEKETVQT
jgi:hypothetical protein